MAEEEDDENEIIPVPEGTDLESFIKNHSLKYFFEGKQSGDLWKYYLGARQSVLKDYKCVHDARKSVDDFFIDSYIFYRRHADKQEKPMLLTKEQCATGAIRDTLQYLGLLNNDFPFRERKMSFEW